MSRNMLCLKVILVLFVATWLGTSSSQVLLPATETAAPFQVNLDQVSQAGGCLAQFSTRCPSLESPSKPCGGCAAATDRCLTNEPEALVSKSVLVHFTKAVYDGRQGYQVAQPPNTVACGYWIQCMGGCSSVPGTDLYYCESIPVSGIQYTSTLVNPNIIVTCDNDGLANRTPELELFEALAMANGIGVKQFMKLQVH